VAAVLVLGAAAPVLGARAPERVPVMPTTGNGLDGERVKVRSSARIVSLNGDFTEVIYALGLGKRLVGADTSATFPAAARAKQNIGYQRQLSAEGILSLRPTVVIGSTLAGPTSVLRQIDGAGVPTVVLPEDDTVRAPVNKIRNIARVLGVPRRGAVLAARVTRQLRAQSRAAARLARGKRRPRVAFLYLRGPRVQLIGGRASRSNTVIRYARGVDVGAEVTRRDFVPISAEALVAAKPDVLVVTDSGLASVGGVAGLLRIPGVAQTPAGRARRVLAYDDQLLLGLGPRLPSAVRKLAVGLYGRPA
jgi:iron complex transport system substrate-binding protein